MQNPTRIWQTLFRQTLCVSIFLSSSFLFADEKVDSGYLDPLHEFVDPLFSIREKAFGAENERGPNRWLIENPVNLQNSYEYTRIFNHRTQTGESLVVRDALKELGEHPEWLALKKSDPRYEETKEKIEAFVQDHRKELNETYQKLSGTYEVGGEARHFLQLGFGVAGAVGIPHLGEIAGGLEKAGQEIDRLARDGKQIEAQEKYAAMEAEARSQGNYSLAVLYSLAQKFPGSAFVAAIDESFLSKVRVRLTSSKKDLDDADQEGKQISPALAERIRKVLDLAQDRSRQPTPEEMKKAIGEAFQENSKDFLDKQADLKSFEDLQSFEQAMQDTIDIGSTLLGLFGQKQSAHAFAVLGDSFLKAEHGIMAIEFAKKGIGNQSLNMACLNSVSIFLGAASAIASLFGDDTDATEVILKSINELRIEMRESFHALSRQLQEMQRENQESFAHLDLRIQDLMELSAKHFYRVEGILSLQQKKMDDLGRQLYETRLQLDTLRSDIYEVGRQILTSQLNKSRNNCIRDKISSLTYDQGPPNFRDCLSDFFTFANDTSKSPPFQVRPGGNSISNFYSLLAPTDGTDWLASSAEKLGVLVEMARSQFHQDIDSHSANPQAWSDGVSLYIDALHAHPEFHEEKQIEHFIDNLTDLAKTGDLIQTNMAAFSANQSQLILEASKSYLTNLSRLQAVLATIAEEYNSDTLGREFASLNLFEGRNLSGAKIEAHSFTPRGQYLDEMGFRSIEFPLSPALKNYLDKKYGPLEVLHVGKIHLTYDIEINGPLTTAAFPRINERYQDPDFWDHWKRLRFANDDVLKEFLKDGFARNAYSIKADDTNYEYVMHFRVIVMGEDGRPIDSRYLLNNFSAPRRTVTLARKAVGRWFAWEGNYPGEPKSAGGKYWAREFEKSASGFPLPKDFDFGPNRLADSEAKLLDDLVKGYDPEQHLKPGKEETTPFEFNAAEIKHANELTLLQLQKARLGFLEKVSKAQKDNADLIEISHTLDALAYAIRDYLVLGYSQLVDTDPEVHGLLFGDEPILSASDILSSAHDEKILKDARPSVLSLKIGNFANVISAASDRVSKFMSFMEKHPTGSPHPLIEQRMKLINSTIDQLKRKLK